MDNKLLKLAFATMPFAPVVCQGQTASSPNVIIILADDMGYAGVTCFGGENLTTPNIDALYAQGLACTNFHAAPVSSATRVQLLTGCYQQKVGLNGVCSAVGKKDGLCPQTNPAFVKQLQAAGYATGIYGKWHLGLDESLNPVEHGFDDFRGFLIGNIDLVSHRDRFNKLDWMHNKLSEDEPGKYATYLINDHSVDFIHQNADKPFFLFVSHGAIHVPMVGPNDPTTRDGKDICSYRNDTDMPVPEYQRVYREMVKSIDDGVGQIMQALKEENLLENALVIFMSDNGAEQIATEKYPGANGAFRSWKGTTFEGGTRVPAIFSMPGTVKPGVNNDLMSTMDIMPTILQMCGIDYKTDSIDGKSLLQTLKKGKKVSDRKLFSANMSYTSLIDGKWKLVWSPDGTFLFDIKKDPKETTDLSQKYTKKASAMKDEILSWWNDCAKGNRLEGTSPVPEKPVGNLAQLLKYE
ncbi:MAG: sulfatase-like hydrolase/transferase [Bacteroidales bacterium]|nr:sulfatase-like hydrolase/transferase [Bacteroidales bacterium]